MEQNEVVQASAGKKGYPLEGGGFCNCAQSCPGPGEFIARLHKKGCFFSKSLQLTSWSISEVDSLKNL